MSRFAPEGRSRTQKFRQQCAGGYRKHREHGILDEEGAGGVGGGKDKKNVTWLQSKRIAESNGKVFYLRHCNKIPIYVFLFRGVRPQSQFLHLCVCERFIYSQDCSTYFPAAEQADGSWKYRNISQIYECRNWETEHYYSVLEKRSLHTVSFLGIHQWELGIYIGLLPALHLQW